MSLFPTTGSADDWLGRPGELRGTATSVAFVVHSPIEPDAAGSAVTDLLALMDTPEQAREYAHRIVFDFTAHGARGRPPHAVVAVRDYLQAVHRQWAWWMHFLVPDPSEWLTVLLAIAPITRDAGEGRYVTSVPALRALVAQMMRATRALHRHVGIPKAESRAILATSRVAIARALPAIAP
jgi:hypothetical protein